MNLRSTNFIGRIKTFILLTPALAVPYFAMASQVWADGEFPEPVPAVKTYEWTVTAAREPNPALKYRFLVPLAERTSGNASVAML